MNYSRIMKSSFIAASLVLSSFFYTATVVNAAQVEDSPALSTRLALRGLWVEHINWVRNYALAYSFAQHAVAEAAEAEVVSNARAIAAAITPLYGQDAGEQLFMLLAGHWGAIKAYSAASVDASKAGQEAAMTKLGDNAAALASFLAGANPFLPEATLVSLLSAHGAQHVQQIEQIQASQFTAEASTWAEMRTHIIAISDALSAALVQQFPDKF